MQRANSVTAFRKELSKYIQSQLLPVCASDVCWYIHPYVTLHTIKLTEDALLFLNKELMINYGDVLCMNVYHSRLEILLRNGYLYLLSGDSSEIKIIDIGSDITGSCALGSRLWWKTAGSHIQLNYWRLKDRIRHIVLTQL